MNQRSFTALLLLAAIVGSILYLWQPWNPGQPSLRLGLDLQGGLRVTLQAVGTNPTAEELASARGIIENRVNEFGVSEALVQTSGGNRVVVELPGLEASDQDRALDLIGQQAVLEFRLVKPFAVDPLTLDDLEPTAFTGEIIRTASADFNRSPGAPMGPVVLFEIRNEDVAAFGNFTGSAIGRRMAIVLDDRVITAPQLQGRISDSGQITGIGSLEEAADIALVLRSGSLPFNLEVAEVRQIGPTLGRDSIASGTRAGLIGAAAVVVSVLLYYGPVFGGVLALGLALAMLFVFGVLAGLGAAITLPGLAGLVLTTGAAIDGNVISFERIREELRAGKSMRLAMKTGFANSLSAIIDANVTSLFAAAALYQYTSGPVRGFAVTLAVGIIASVFVNTVVVPFILGLIMPRVKRPLLPRGFTVEGIRFVGRAPIVMPITVILSLAALFLMTTRDLNLSTDFTGGINVLYQVPEDTTVTDVRAAVDELPDVAAGSATIVEVEDPNATGKQISVRVGSSAGVGVNENFASNLGEMLGATVLSADVVGPAVGADLRRGAVMAVVVALALILAYMAWRFWPNWPVGVGTIIASVHDVLIVMGVLVISGAEFSIPVLAALLFVVGYSMNDSVIIADRIRENLGKIRGMSYAEIVDTSVNQTLSRTVMTGATTLLPVTALLLFGGPVLRDFSIVLVVGILVGTYSSIYVMSPILVWFRNWQGTRSAARRRHA